MKIANKIRVELINKIRPSSLRERKIIEDVEEIILELLKEEDRIITELEEAMDEIIDATEREAGDFYCTTCDHVNNIVHTLIDDINKG